MDFDELVEIKVSAEQNHKLNTLDAKQLFAS